MEEEKDKKELFEVELEPLKEENPYVDFKFVDKVIESLKVMEIELDHNPILHDSQRLNQKIAEARNLMNSCVSLLVKVMKQSLNIKRVYNKEKSLFDIQINFLLTNDPDVQAQPNHASKMASASLKEMKKHVKISLLEQALGEWSTVEALLKMKKTDLKDVQTRLRQQMNLCLEELKGGGRWLKKPPGTKLPSLSSGGSSSGFSISEFFEEDSTKTVVESEVADFLDNI